MATSLTARDGGVIQPPSARYSDPPSSATASGTSVMWTEPASALQSLQQQQQPVRHIPIAVWLTTIGLPEYLQQFSGYSGVEEVLYLQELDVKNLGVRHPGHRARIVTSLAMLKRTYEQHAGVNDFAHGRLRASKSAGNLSFAGGGAALSTPGFGSGGAQFSIDSAAAKRMLEAELKLDSSNLRSYAWFHGAISRQQAEATLLNNGEFLVRESTSQPGDYVLTCCWNNVPLHFVINKHVTQTGAYSRVQYAFEGTAYDSVPALVMSYVSEKKRVTQASGVVISQPVSRSIPITLLDRYRELQQQSPAAATVPAYGTYGDGGLDRLQQPAAAGQSWTGSRVSSSSKRVDSLPQLPQASGANGLLFGEPFRTNGGGGGGSAGVARRGSSSSSGSREDLPSSASGVERSESLPAHSSGASAAGASVAPPTIRNAGSEPALLDSDHSSTSSNGNNSNGSDGDERAASDGDLSRPASAKPSRLPSIKKKDRPPVEIRNKALYDDDGKDYSDYEQVRRPPGATSSPFVVAAVTKAPVYDKNSNRISDLTTEGALGSRDKDDLIYDMPKAGGSAERISFREPVIPSRYLDPAHFSTSLLPEGNKPLEPSAMYQIKEALLHKEYRLLAKHITHLDLHLLKVINNKNLGASIYSGLEAMTLPQGTHFREAVVERHYTLSYLVAVTILACTDDQHERALMLKQWVLIAAELLRSLGNLFAFYSIAEGLLHPSVARLHGTWSILRQAEPQMTHVFETRLRTTYCALNAASSGSLTLSDDVCIPHVLPVAELLLTAADNIAVPSPPSCRPPAAAELDVTLAHLDTARYVGSRTASYHRKGDAVVAYFAPNPTLRDMFKVEFHMKLLYGCHGAMANRCDRFQKFQQILAILSKRAEPYDGTEL